MQNTYLRRYCSSMHFASSRIFSLESIPLYKNKGNPSSMVIVLIPCIPSLYSKIAIGNLSPSTIKNRLSFTITSLFENSCFSNRKKMLSFADKRFSSLIRSASDVYMTFKYCLWLYVNARLIGFLGSCSFTFLTELRPIKKPMNMPSNNKNILLIHIFSICAAAFALGMSPEGARQNSCSVLA
jgi:hypothetical protein